MLGLVWLVHAPCAAGLGDWSSYDTYLSRALEMLSGGKMHDPDIAFPAERAGELAAAAGHPARARRAWELAVLEWKTLGRAADASRVQARLDSL